MRNSRAPVPVAALGDGAESNIASVFAAPSEGPIIYTHVRNLSGVLHTLEHAPPHDDTPLPFLGSLAMGYFGAHGYDVSSILHVAAAFVANSEPDDFATQLAHKGLPLLEGLFLWQIIEFGRAEMKEDKARRFQW